MNDQHLIPYLNGHLAGALSAIELLEHWHEVEEDTDARALLAELLSEIREDQQTLREVLSAVGGSESAIRKTVAWLAEKIDRLKTSAAGGSPSAWAFYRVEHFEILIVGVRGKLALWESLQVIRSDDERLGAFDWAGLRQRATSQISRADQLRLRAAREAFR